ncbi:LytR/AlgR family response regulator transcription factor [Maribacter hydrothermalis]|uniref:DNA-binding response regulator n=1 Tax=Maribacter hydrothermalis TaxID=1836467 RepID=A0A1B7Z8F1_9FLAO|nr:LytTR family DNA-binding domain-containing protein [Maribacter hydrothermalis]APQ19014.1 DNA-binding response regulator [Maribacter hydrothermalis]OBR38973.1 DNA-binding response regulator [Maribacter hydrothermalis]
MTSINCIVVDDEELARALLITYVEKLDFLNLVGEAENPLEALQLMKEHSVDLLFLDIQMPEIKGTDFAKMVNANTKIIFTTAYSQYALEGYELNAVDYLLKPITFERFVTAVNKVKTNVSTEKSDTITIKSGYDLHKVKYDDILYVVSDSEYVTFHMGDKKIISNQRLKTLEQELPSSMFMRVHRSYIINKNSVTGLKGRDLLLSDVVIPVSDSYYDMVKEELF